MTQSPGSAPRHQRQIPANLVSAQDVIEVRNDLDRFVFEDGTVLIADEAVNLNGPAMEILESFDGHRTLDEAVALVADRHDLTSEQVEGWFPAAIEAFAARHLLANVGPPVNDDTDPNVTQPHSTDPIAPADSGSTSEPESADCGASPRVRDDEVSARGLRIGVPEPAS